MIISVISVAFAAHFTFFDFVVIFRVSLINSFIEIKAICSSPVALALLCLNIVLRIFLSDSPNRN